MVAFDDDVWELYRRDDWTRSRDLTAEQPDTLHRLQRLWLIEAAITAQIVMPNSGAEGVMLTQGGMAGGWSLHARDRRLRYCYNLVGLRRFYVDSETKIPAGEHQGPDGVRLRLPGPGQGRHSHPLPAGDSEAKR